MQLKITDARQFLNRIRKTWVGSFGVFVIKQGWAALFGGLLLAGIIVTNYVDLPLLARYDWLFIWAIMIQAGMLLFRLEKPHEVLTILLFHVVGLGMELFKTAPGVGSWYYPGDAVIRLWTVPLFSGFMYAAVGSYIARAWRVLHLRFTHYPNRWLTVILALLIYANFFTHHYIYDFRWLLFAAVALLYCRTWVYFTFDIKEHRMPLLLGFGLIAFFVWLAENIATYTEVWLYPNQVTEWQIVGLQKFGSWFLLMIINFIMIEVLHHLRSEQQKKIT